MEKLVPMRPVTIASMQAWPQRFPRHLIVFLLCFGCCLLTLSANAQEDASTDNGIHPILKIGSPAPSFNLMGVDGKMHSLNEYAAAKVLVVIFSCNHCPIAQMYEKRIKQLVTDYHSKGVAIVVIMGNDPKAERLSELAWTDVGDTFDDMKIRAKYRSFNYPYLYDGDDQKITRAYGPSATPHVFVFDKRRILRYEGRIDSNAREALAKKAETRDAINALLAGQPVAVTDTPTTGCSTKWASKSTSVQQEIAQLNALPVVIEPASAAYLTKLRSNGTGKLLVINFWATWCGPCLMEFPDLVRLSRIYRERDIQVVTVSINSPDEKDRVLSFLKKEHATTKNLIFDGDDAADAVKAFGTGWTGGAPYTVVITPAGQVVYKEQGSLNLVALRRAMLKAIPDDHFLGQHDYWNSTF